MRKEYKTVLHPAAAEFEEKKSRFIASVKPVSAEEEAVAFINEMKTRYWDARHNVYSYYICGNNTIGRYSDDGEPSGTAGLPVLEVIKRMGVEDVAVVVTRYFGGILLGAAGLIRAYSKSASLGIEAAGVVRRQLSTQMNVIIEYNLLGKVQNSAITSGYIIKNTVYGQDVEITVLAPTGEEERFTELMTETTNARAIVEAGEKVYITLDGDGKLITG